MLSWDLADRGGEGLELHRAVLLDDDNYGLVLATASDDLLVAAVPIGCATLPASVARSAIEDVGVLPVV